VRTALFIGRFQPFHNGHLQVLETMCKTFDKVIIGIGSSNVSGTEKNPYDLKTRKKMIRNSLKQFQFKNFKIIEIPDINDPPNWVNHVLSIVSDFNVIITNNPFTEKLFEEKGYFVMGTCGYDENTRISSTQIRKKMKENDESWKELVPKPVVDIIMRMKK